MVFEVGFRSAKVFDLQKKKANMMIEDANKHSNASRRYFVERFLTEHHLFCMVQVMYQNP